MKKLNAFACLLVLTCQFAWGMNINPTHTGTWYNPNQSGHGLSVEVLDSNITVIYWYVYHTDGTPQFLITVGINDGNKTSGTTYYNSGMKFGEFDPNDIVEEVWGESSLTVDGCSSGVFEYSSNAPAYGSGSIQMTKVLSVEGVKCRNNPLQNTYHMTLSDGNSVAVGALHVFENGYASFWGVSEYGGAVGIGQMTVIDEDRFEMDLTSFDLHGGGWDEEYVTGEYEDGSVKMNLDGGGIAFGTGLRNFQQSLSYDAVAAVYDIRDLVAGQIIGILTLDDQGNVSGNTLSGCAITGWYTIPDTQFNQLYLEINLTGCSMNPDMRGAGNGGADKTIVLAMTDYYNGQVWALER